MQHKKKASDEVNLCMLPEEDTKVNKSKDEHSWKVGLFCQVVQSGQVEAAVAVRREFGLYP